MNSRSSLCLVILLAACQGSDNGSDASTTRGDEHSTTFTSSEPVTTGAMYQCGNAVLESGETCDNGPQNGPGNPCLENCSLNVCGDGDVLVGIEACDDGNEQSSDGCSAECVLEGSCANSILVNPGFEGGALEPWETNGVVSLTTEGPHAGAMSASFEGNFYLEQIISPTPTSMIINANFWSWHDGEDKPLLLVEWFYNDDTFEQRLFQDPLNGWQQHDILDDLDAGKSLIRIRVWGYQSAAPAPDLAKFDDFSFCASM